MNNLRPISLSLYGLAVIANGLYRYFSAPDGTNGLGFGLVMGIWALIAALLLFLRVKLFGLILGWSAVLVVGIWFCLELQDKYKQPRIWIIIALSIVMIGVLLWPARAKATLPPA